MSDCADRPSSGPRMPRRRLWRDAMPTLVTGGAGFIGSTPGRPPPGRRRARSSRVDNFDPFYAAARKRANLAAALRSPRFRLVEARHPRRRRPSTALVAEVRPDAIVHLAARAGVRPSIDDPALYAEVNVVGTVHLLDAACRLDPRPRFVYASSSSVYGDRARRPVPRDRPGRPPVSPYAATKKACELLAHTFHHLHGLPVTGLRFFTAYGPRNRPDLAIAKFADLIDRGRARPDVRRRHDPPRLHLRRRHRRRDRPRRRPLRGPPPLQPRQLRPGRAPRR